MTYKEAKKEQKKGDVIIWKDSFLHPDNTYDLITEFWLDTDEFEGSMWEVVE